MLQAPLEPRALDEGQWQTSQFSLYSLKGAPEQAHVHTDIKPWG
jgi:hypothetical protein